MSYLVVAIAAFAVSALTLFSGFGLGTLLMPVFAFFFPVEVAVAATAVVHVLNNLFKLALLGRDVDRTVLLRFGLPAVGAAFIGALLLETLAGMPALYEWRLGEARVATVTPIKLVMGVLILGFALLELVPALHRWRVAPKWLPLGGALSGFFGGLSGHQGALRAAFLAPLGLTPAAFAGSQAAIACMVDAARLLIYGVAFYAVHAAAVGDDGDPATAGWPLIATATAAAFAGALLGRRLLPKITVGFVRILTGILLLIVGAGLATGVI